MIRCPLCGWIYWGNVHECIWAPEVPVDDPPPPNYPTWGRKERPQRTDINSPEWMARPRLVT